MKPLFGRITLLILFAIVSACSGPSKKKTQLGKPERVDKVESEIKISIPENGFSSGHIDKQGNLWFGSNGAGIFLFDGKSFTNYTEKDGLSSNQVFSIFSDNKNNIWFGTQNGLTKYDRNRFEHIPLPYQDTTSAWLDKVYPVINPNAVHALATDKNDNLWIGTAGGGAYHYDGKIFKSYLTAIGRKQEDSLYHNWIPYISKDKKRKYLVRFYDPWRY